MPGVLTMTTTPIGSGRALFFLPDDQFINAIQPLQPLDFPTLTGPLSELEAVRFVKTGAVPKLSETKKDVRNG